MESPRCESEFINSVLSPQMSGIFSEDGNVVLTMMDPLSLMGGGDAPMSLTSLLAEVDDETGDFDDAAQKDINVIDIFALIEQKRKEIVPEVNISPLSVSTQSAKATMTKIIPLQQLADCIYQAIDENIYGGKREDFCIVGLEYKDIRIGPIKKRSKKPSGQKGKAFPNNCTILVKSPMGTGRTINIKVFQNGSISMTGCKIKEDGIAVTKILEKFLCKQLELFDSKQEAKEFKIRDFCITMINSNYSIGFNVERVRLYDIFCKKYPKLDVTYEPNSYSGVKIRFFYNDVNPNGQDGVCHCPSMGKANICRGKSTGNGVGKCKAVTIAIFQSGNIINTGGRNMTQTTTAYNYINDIIREYADEIIRISLHDLEKMEGC